jgi:SSS family solute:Na+ symporter
MSRHNQELAVFIVLCAIVTIVGFGAARWRQAKLDHLDEWGLAGRRFGTVIIWFLLGGDLYTAYTFIAVPGLVFASGAYGLFAVPYTILVYPVVFLVMPKLWQVARNRGYVTASDYVKDRFDSRLLALLIALTGIVATMPYIALQIFGIRMVIAQMGVNIDAALVIAFLVLAAFTYASGLRAPALIALVKDTLIWITVLVAVIYIPIKLGGYGAIFHKVAAVEGKKPYLTITRDQYAAYASLAFGSALALFLYPHALTGVFASRGQSVIRRNAAFLPAYSFMLGLIALLGYMAIASGITTTDSRLAAPLLFRQMFPSWFAGVAFAAVAIGALVPAAIMSIAAANLFTRNIYRELLRRRATPAEQARVSKLVSLVVKFGALAFVLGLNTQDAINLQLLGGVWILQTFPAVAFGLFTRWLHRWALLAGWLAGMVYGSYIAYGTHTAKISHFASPTAVAPLLHQNVYIGVTALVINLVIAVVGTLLLRLVAHSAGADETVAHDYVADAGEPGMEPTPTLTNEVGA